MSSLGRIKSVGRWVNSNGGVRYVKEKIRLQSMDLNGYLVVGIKIGGVVKTRKVHLIVADGFIKKKKEKKYINHINGIKSDNRRLNLERVTASENMFHASKNNLLVKRNGQDSHLSILTNRKVLNIFKSNDTHINLSKKYKVSRTTITLIKTGRNWSKITGKNYERKY